MLDGLAAGPREAWLRLRDELQDILGPDLVAIWAYGSLVGEDRPIRPADLDTHVVLRKRPSAAAAERIQAALEADPDTEFDAWFITLEDARRGEQPAHAFREGRRDTSWAVHRAHWLAGRVVTLFGSEPSDVVLPPAWDQIQAELDRELEHIERHVVDGDTDPYEASYAVLNGSRILWSLATRDPVRSKREAGAWALANLPERWHPAIAAALRAYDEQQTRDEEALLSAEMAPFTAMVREQLPRTNGHAGDAPRWSGY
jgi:hypothetical protein